MIFNQLMIVAQKFRDGYHNDGNGDIGVKRNLSSLLGPFLRGEQRRNPYNASQTDLSRDPLQSLINIMRGFSAPVCIEGLAQLALNLPDLA